MTGAQMTSHGMHRRFEGAELVVASHNPGKVREIADLLAPLGIRPLGAAALGLPEPEETGSTFAENAELKAHAAAQASGRPALADDSGLSVRCLAGAPGIFSARWAGPDKDFGKAMARVWQAVQDQAPPPEQGPPDLAAHFTAALSLAWPDGHCDTFLGEIHGRLVWPPRGDRGFGYDPMFLAEGCTLTFGEMEPDEKHAISHRAIAFRKLLDGCFGGA
ncbi:MAG: RdgB/HAM1 family non-canonical purine NTP pyrophosphatase [Sneathiellaceae bacterium]